MENRITYKVIARVLNMALPDPTQSSVGVMVAMGKLGEFSKKGWILTEENLGNGYKSLAGGHVNWAHTSKLLGYVKEVEIANGEVVATLMLSRRALDEAGIDPEEFQKKYAVSVEWYFAPAESYVEVNGQRLDLTDAADAGYVLKQTGPLGNVEIVVNRQKKEKVEIYPKDIQFTDLAILDKRYNPPNFPSARILELTNSLSAEAILHSVYKEVEAWAENEGAGGFIEEINTIPSEGNVKSGEVHAIMGDKCFRFLYNTNEEGGVELRMDDLGFQVSSLPFERDLFILLGAGAAPSEKEGGHKTPPKEYRGEGAGRRGQYADPTNYRYPLHTEANARNAVARFGNPKNRQQYTHEEQVFIAKRIVAAARKYGIEVSPDSDVGKLAGVKGDKSESEAASAKHIEAFCPQCKEVMTMSHVEETEVKGRKALKGECPEGHTMYRFASSMLTNEVVSSLMEQALEGGLLRELWHEEVKESMEDNKDFDVEKVKSEAASEAVAKYEAEVLPKKIEEAIGAKFAEIEAQKKSEEWMAKALSELTVISPLTDQEKEEVTKLLSESPVKEKDLELLMATRKTGAAEAKIAELTARFGLSMAGAVPWLSASSDSEKKKEEEEFTL